MESMKGVWNGDVNLGDSQLNLQQTDYETRQQALKDPSESESGGGLEESLQKRIIDEFQLNEEFILEGLGAAVRDTEKVQ